MEHNYWSNFIMICWLLLNWTNRNQSVFRQNVADALGAKSQDISMKLEFVELAAHQLWLAGHTMTLKSCLDINSQ